MKFLFTLIALLFLYPNCSWLNIRSADKERLCRYIDSLSNGCDISLLIYLDARHHKSKKVLNYAQYPNYVYRKKRVDRRNYIEYRELFSTCLAPQPSQQLKNTAIVHRRSFYAELVFQKHRVMTSFLSLHSQHVSRKWMASHSITLPKEGNS